MEVGVKVEGEDPLTGVRTHTASAYLTFVALEADGSRARVPRLVPETDEDLRRMQAADRRREQRLRSR
jgi:acyl-CoA hydrolase